MTNEQTELDKLNALHAAVNAVAQRVVRNAVFDGITGGRIDWSDYPELSENDWHVVANRALTIAAGMDVDNQLYESSYELLSARAEVSE